ncbi:alkaline phosphatase family protein [uncultured Maribacter sp.]|uniref:alkaline phosphatase family protein n=1 Tax=uncultured Maribacter sp. TaxID=431308 RepID=UPI0030DA2ADE|tara:strand:+ start:4660 stop:6339 length:1680 start_codon:yes stop_codon:yes gene_type:complete
MLIKEINKQTKLSIISSVLLTIGIFSLWSCNYKDLDTMDEQKAEHVIVIGFDGLSPDGLKKANTPTFDRLIKEGASTIHARSVLPSSSSPNWASMIMGAGPEQHGITSNAWNRDNLTLPAVTQSEQFIFPTIFQLVADQRDSSEIGAIYHWGGFGRLFEKDAVNYDINPMTEDETSVIASEYIKEKNPDLTFIHFDHIDHAGHEYGHGTPAYYASVEKADSLLAELIESLRASGMAENTLVIISADHGGVGKGHGGESLQEVEIPFILWGKGIKKNYNIKYPVYQYDNAATVAFAMDIRTPHAWIGKPVKEAFEGNTVEDSYPTLVQLNKPTFVPSSKGYVAQGGLFNDKANLILKNPNNEGILKYTLDGTLPTNESKTFEAEIPITENTVVNSAIFIDGKMSSEVVEGFFRIKSRVFEEPVTVEVFYRDDLSFLPSLGIKKPDIERNTFEINSEEVKELIKSNTVFRFKSGLEIEEAGSYQFSTRSDDGSQLFINGELVVDNDGDHGVREKSSAKELSKGKHNIEVLWFNGGGDGWLDVYVQSEKMPKQILSTNLLRR